MLCQLAYRIITGVTILVGLSFSHLSIAEIQTEGWREYQSPHFIVWSDRDASDVRATLEEFEIFRTVVTQQLSLPIQTNNKKVKIYLFDSVSEYQLFAPAKTAGYFINPLYGPFMVVGPKSQTAKYDNQTLYHEYLHYLLSSSSNFQYPFWYNEGLAEYYSSMEIKSDHIIIGKAPSRVQRKALSRAALSNIDELMSGSLSFRKPGNLKSLNRQYANAWLLVHFLSHAKSNGIGDYLPALNQYLTLINQGLDHHQAFSQSFDIDMETLKEQLVQYTKSERLYLNKVALPKAGFTMTTTDVPRGQMLKNFAQLAFDSGKKHLNKGLHERAIAQENSVSLSFNALMSARDGDEDAAKQWLEQALVGKNIESDTFVNIARVFLILSRGPSSQTKAKIHSANYYINKALELEPTAQGYFYASQIAWQMGNQQLTVDYLAKLVKLAPSNLRVNLMVGSRLAQVGDTQLAKHFLTNVINWDHSGVFARRAQTRMTQINSN